MDSNSVTPISCYNLKQEFDILGSQCLYLQSRMIIGMVSFKVQFCFIQFRTLIMKSSIMILFSFHPKRGSALFSPLFNTDFHRKAIFFLRQMICIYLSHAHHNAEQIGFPSNPRTNARDESPPSGHVPSPEPSPPEQEEALFSDDGSHQ